jgi:hypothetical protein
MHQVAGSLRSGHSRSKCEYDYLLLLFASDKAPKQLLSLRQVAKIRTGKGQEVPLQAVAIK